MGLKALLKAFKPLMERDALLGDFAQFVGALGKTNAVGVLALAPVQSDHGGWRSIVAADKSAVGVVIKVEVCVHDDLIGLVG